MDTLWDLASYDRANQLVLVVEVKSQLNTSPEWAARLRRNILAHSTFPNAPYFLMVFPDRFYLWKDTDLTDEPIAPTYVTDAGPVFQPYFAQSGIAAHQISGSSFELIVASWLNTIIHMTPDQLDAPQQWLIESGLYSAVFGGSLGQQVLV